MGRVAALLRLAPAPASTRRPKYHFQLVETKVSARGWLGAQTTTMALQEVTTSFLRRLRLAEKPLHSVWTSQCQRYASSDATTTTTTGQEVSELEATEFHATPSDAAEKRLSEYSPLERSRRRRAQLPASRCAYIHDNVYKWTR